MFRSVAPSHLAMCSSLPMLSVCELIPRVCDQLFAEAGVMAIEHADFVGVERLAAVIGGT